MTSAYHTIVLYSLNPRLYTTATNYTHSIALSLTIGDGTVLSLSKLNGERALSSALETSQGLQKENMTRA